MALIYDTGDVSDLRNIYLGNWVKEEDYLKARAVNQKLYEALVHALDHQERMKLPFVIQDKMIKAVEEAEKV